jgi:pyruvate formate lyase activating enzyme
MFSFRQDGKPLTCPTPAGLLTSLRDVKGGTPMLTRTGRRPMPRGPCSPRGLEAHDPVQSAMIGGRGPPYTIIVEVSITHGPEAHAPRFGPEAHAPLNPGGRYNSATVPRFWETTMSRSIALKTLLYDNTMAADPALVRVEHDPRGDGNTIRCLACGHRCVIRDGRAGVCRVRFNRGGELRVPAGYVAGVQIDPIEKKPFYHAFPGRDALSFGMLGCDFHCGYCQNWVTSQALRDDQATSLPNFCEPERLVDLAVRHGAPVMVSTYNEPLITSEWAVEIYKQARQRGIVCGYVSNGNGTPEVLEFIRPYVDLYKVDLKGFDDKHYRELGGVLSNVLETIKRLKRMDFWVEIVTLVVPGFNDSDDELKQIAEFIASVDTDIPWHITAFHPDYKMRDRHRTPTESLLQGYEFGKAAGLKYCYPGNLPGAVGDRENTYCPDCGALLIRRYGFYVEENRMGPGGTCPDCAAQIPGVWESAAPHHSNGTGIPRPVALR